MNSRKQAAIHCIPRSRNGHGCTLKGLAVAVSLSSTGVAWGQDRVAMGPMLEEVVVTAERRQQSLQDVPISIAALDEQALEKFGISELEDLGAKIPNVVTNEYFGIATTFRSFIRGVGAVTVEVTQDPAVALYVDGIYVGSSYGGSFESSDLVRIEVLRGPQGTLYGRNATGGAINLISRKPELRGWGFDQALTTGNFGAFKSNTAVNVPLGDKAAVRAGYLSSHRDGWVENTGPGEDYGVQDREVARLALKVEPSEYFAVDFSADYTRIEDTTQYSQVLSGYARAVSGADEPITIPAPPPAPPGTTIDIFYPDAITAQRLDKAFSLFEISPDDNTILGTALTLSLDVSENTVLKSITGYRDVDATQYTQVTGTVQTYTNIPALSLVLGPHTLGTGGIYKQEFSQLTQEFQLVGSWNSPLGNVEYVTGLYYYADEGDNEDLTMNIGGPRAPGSDRTETENDSIALYGQATWAPRDSRWRITLGARYSQDQREAKRTNLNSVPAFDGTVYDKEFENFSPSLTVAYDISDDVNLYGKVVTGYRSGGTSTLSFNEDLFKVGADEETIISYELGMKGDFFERRARVNGAIFAMDYQDYQGSIQTGPSPANRDVLNIGDNTIRGFELDVAALVSDSLTFSLATGFLDTEMGEDTVVPRSPLAPATALVDDLPYAPRWSYSATLDYVREIGNGLVLEGHLNYTYQDESESGIQLGTSQLNDAHGLWDLRLALSGIRMIGGRVKLAVWGRNLSDEEYVISNIGAFADLGAAEISPFGTPRTYGVTLTYQYD